VKRRAVEFSEDARGDLIAFYDWIATAAGAAVSLSYIERLEAYILSFDIASERGHLREVSVQVCASSDLSAA
jgi:toxin ParE1/3/4